MNSKPQEKRIIYHTKLTLVIQEFTKNQTFSHACPKVVPEGPEVVKGGALGDFGVPLGTLLDPFASPWTPLWVPLDRPGSIWGLTETLWGSPGGNEASNYINKLPINRQSGQMLIPGSLCTTVILAPGACECGVG